MAVDATKPVDNELIKNWPTYIRSIADYVNSLAALVGGDFSRQVDTLSLVSTVLTIADLNKIYVVNSAVALIHQLPEVTTAHKGMWIRFHKLGTGDLTALAGGTDAIANGGAASGLINAESEAKASFIELEVVGTGQWCIAGMFGTWNFI